MRGKAGAGDGGELAVGRGLRAVGRERESSSSSEISCSSKLSKSSLCKEQRQRLEELRGAIGARAAATEGVQDAAAHGRHWRREARGTNKQKSKLNADDNVKEAKDQARPSGTRQL